MFVVFSLSIVGFGVSVLPFDGSHYTRVARTYKIVTMNNLEVCVVLPFNYVISLYSASTYFECVNIAALHTDTHRKYQTCKYRSADRISKPPAIKLSFHCKNMLLLFVVLFYLNTHHLCPPTQVAPCKSVCVCVLWFKFSMVFGFHLDPHIGHTFEYPYANSQIHTM